VHQNRNKNIFKSHFSNSAVKRCIIAEPTVWQRAYKHRVARNASENDRGHFHSSVQYSPGDAEETGKTFPVRYPVCGHTSKRQTPKNLTRSSIQLIHQERNVHTTYTCLFLIQFQQHTKEITHQYVLHRMFTSLLY
jgi:hypothetical protein